MWDGVEGVKGANNKGFFGGMGPTLQGVGDRPANVTVSSIYSQKYFHYFLYLALFDLLGFSSVSFGFV